MIKRKVIVLGYYIVAIFTLIVVFILFLVISRTVNNMVNLLVKIEYVIQREFDIRDEAVKVKKLMEEESMLNVENLEEKTERLNE